MSKTKANQPIGIFDSGVGGLTIAHSLLKRLPNEDVIYFGDTAHFPYGDKSNSAIQTYASQISDFLLEQSVKCIVIACNTASSVAYDYLQKSIDGRALLFNVIDPVIESQIFQQTPQTVGLIATRSTVQSQRYQHRFHAKGIHLKAHATPLLAAAIEEGFAGTPIMQHLIAHYLSSSHLANIEKLILGCTHYPIIAPEIKHYYHQVQKSEVQVIDPAKQVAEYIADTLKREQLLNDQGQGLKACYLSDVTESFSRSAELFFAHTLDVIKYPLWD